MADIPTAVAAIDAGDLVVYPTETVYGLGADATDPAAIERVFALKGRDRDEPLSVAIPRRGAVDDIARQTPRTRRFMERFLPGPVTVVCERRSTIPDVLTGGRDRVGVRLPAHPLARELLAATPPLTATSANLSGHADARSVDELDDAIREGVAAVLDGGQSSGQPSTVVDVAAGRIHRRGAHADAVEHWLADHPA